jgi:hypothetical protein
MSLSLDCRYASLLAFLESRDSQTRLSFDDRPSQDDGCGRQGGGRFGQGNNCAGGGSGGRGPYARLPDSIRLTPNGSSAKYDEKQLKHGSPFDSAKKAKSLEILDPPAVMEIAKKAGVKDPSDILVIGAATSKGSEVTIDRTSLGQKIEVKTRSPIDPSDASLGDARVAVTIGKNREVHYDYFSPTNKAFQAMADGRVSVATVSASILALMAESLEAAERNGMRNATTLAAGYGHGSTGGPDGSFKGYRLWPKFGFDGEVDVSASQRFASFSDEAMRKTGSSLLSDGAYQRWLNTGRVRVQDIVATPDGEEWWNKNGHQMDMEIDFTDKNSPGYKRYKETVAVGKKAAKRLARQGRSANEFWEWVSRRSGIPTLAEFAEARNCGTGSGGFQKGNTCAGGIAADVAVGAAKGAAGAAVATLGATWFPPLVPKAAAAGAVAGAVKGLYDNQMRPTRVMKAIQKAGSSEKQVASLVKSLGGSPKSSADIKGKSLTLKIKDKDGKKIFDAELTGKSLVITPARESGKLTQSEMDAVKSIAKENAPREVSVVVKSQSPSYIYQLTKKGFKVAANNAGVLVASTVAPFVPGLAGHVIGSTVEAIAKKRK